MIINFHKVHGWFFPQLIYALYIRIANLISVAFFFAMIKASLGSAEL